MNVRHEVLTTTSMKITVFGDVTIYTRSSTAAAPTAESRSVTPRFWRDLLPRVYSGDT